MLRNIILCSMAAVLSMVSCSERNQQTASAEAETFSSDSQTIVVDTAQFLSAVDVIKTTLNRLDGLRAKNYLFVKPVTVEQAYGEALFYNGKIVAVSWRKDALEPLVSAHFNENEEIDFYMTHTQGTDFFTDMFFVGDSESPVFLSRSGYFGEEEYAFSAITANLWAQQFINESFSIEQMAKLFHATGVYEAKSNQGTLYYHGKIDGDAAISLILNRNGDWASGLNYHSGIASNYVITAAFNGNDVIMNEKKGDLIAGKFLGKLAENDNISGQWLSADGSKKLPFELERVHKLKLPNGDILSSAQKSRPSSENLVVQLDELRLPTAVAQEIMNTLSISTTRFLWSGMSTMEKLDSFIVDATFYQDRVNALSLDNHGREIYQRYFLSIFNALPDDFENRHLGYYRSEQAAYEKQDRLFASMIYCIDRSPANLKKWWSHFQGNWSELIYKGYFNEFDTTAIQLINAYEHLITQDEVDSKIKKAYTAIANLEQAQSSLEAQRPFLSPLMQPDKEDQLWAYSFWMRRFQEENHETVYEILKEAYTSIITAEFEYD